MASGSTQHQFWRDQYERIIKHKALSESLRRHERELMENNRELELQKNKAQEANRLQSEFLSNIGHELRTPLTSIIGFSGLIMKTDSRPPAEAEMISRINSQGKELLDRIENLMELSRLDSASVELSPEPIAIGAVLGQVADSLQTQISEAGHTVRVDCENRSLKVVFDYNRMVTVITHLLKNAIKFTPPGGLIETGCYRTDGHVEIYVRDNGVGVSRELQEAIFDRFRQGDGSSTRRHGGSGIGLSIVKSIVELHGGRIRVESEPGKGSEFVVTVPRKTEVREKTSP